MTTMVFLTMQEVRVCVESETLHMIVKRSNSSFMTQCSEIQTCLILVSHVITGSHRSAIAAI